jgi:hypothetical protein
MSRIKDITGQRFGRLVVLGLSKTRTPSGEIKWDCICDCGNITAVTKRNLRSSHTKSCGCLLTNPSKQTSVTHGMTDTVEYKTWESMKARCYNKNNRAYYNYGERGIIVCEEWRDSFINFYRDMGIKPKGLTLDRIDNNGNYEPGNCRWASDADQCKNRRSNINIKLYGQAGCLSDWCKYLEISYHATISTRISKLKWPIACALWIPLSPGRKNIGDFARHKRILNALKY